jgi:hypothetical protein
VGKATESLECEHESIQKAVAVMSRIAAQLEVKHSVRPIYCETSYSL